MAAARQQKHDDEQNIHDTRLRTTGRNVAHDDSGSTDGYNVIGSHDELVRWSRAYCTRAVDRYDFSVDVTLVQWEVSTRAKRRAAAVKTPNVDGTTVGKPIDWTTRSIGGATTTPPACTMSLSWRAFESFDRDEWAATLRHELVHVEQFQTFGATDHGPSFRRRAESVDAPIRVRRFTDPKYVLSCGDCGTDVAYRYRDCKLVRESSAYRSACCGAILDCRTERETNDNDAT
ncbi:transcription elongation protein SprT (plasmid) [Haloferax mediterranei ATCC 33500]|uniref:Transcription elongation protein SprT n=2 Tax=Haloferax mediterranei (strain ATCC 33500 / DSM 1411 / JCM 8866 / NBRC 14739 / NCIMB 2177 / R-4) TaxID=523841 RepID=A0A4P8P921_HALMT|nr:transcription elongation protein SprT [Haloferax mediterranei ATCC 33500]